MLSTILYYKYYKFGLKSLHRLSRKSRKVLKRSFTRKIFKPKMATGFGGGIKGFFKRVWYCITLYYIGTKWGVIEFFTKHKRLSIKGIPKRPGNVAVITGGARGIGAEVVQMLLHNHMHVIIGCRNVGAGNELIKKIRRDHGIPGGKVDVLHLDLMSLASVREFANDILARNIPIHILINNAGVMFCPYKQTEDGFESQFQTNYLGHFLLTNLLLPKIISSGTNEHYSRIVNVSSCAHYGGKIDFDDLQMEKLYSPYNAYMVSKLCQVISSTDLNNKLEKANAKTRAMSVHPGMVQTDLYEHICWFKALHIFVKLLFKNPKQGADTVVYAALSPELEGKGGLYLANSEPWTPNKKVYNPILQESLYNISSQLVGLEDMNFNIPPVRPARKGSIELFLN